MARVVFLGTPEIAVEVLHSLLRQSDLDVVGVITQPDRPAGRGRHAQPSPVKILAQGLDIPILQPPRIRGSAEALAFLESVRPDVMVAVAYGQILPETFFEWPKWGTLNVHTSLLPLYRGAAPVIRAVAAGETVTGVTIMKIDAGLDTGDILSSRELQIGLEETAGELEARLARAGANLLVRTLPLYLSGGLLPHPQNHEGAGLAPRVKKEEGRVDWRRPAQQIHNLVRAFNPRPGCFSNWRGERVKIWRTREPGPSPETAEPATILSTPGQGLWVACGPGSRLEIVEIQPVNRRRMPAVDFTNGYSVKRGDIFR